MVNLYKDPKGEKIFTTHQQHNMVMVHSIAPSDTSAHTVKLTLASAKDTIDTLRRRIVELEGGHMQVSMQWNHSFVETNGT